MRFRLRHKVLLVLACVLVALVVSACGGTVQSKPEVESTPQATKKAIMVEAIVQAAPTATPTQKPQPLATPTAVPPGLTSSPTPTSTPTLTSTNHFQRGEDYATQGDYEKAIGQYDQAILLDRQYAFAYYHRGIAYAALRQYERAIRDFDEAIRLDPQEADAYHKRGVEYGTLGQYKRAIEDLDEVIRLDPQNAIAYYHRGIAYSAREQYQRAIGDLDQALELDRFYSQAYRLRGDTYRELGQLLQARFDDAFAESTGAFLDDPLMLNQVIIQGPQDAEDYKTRGLAYLSIGEHARAIRDLDQALTLAPRNAKFHFNRGRAYSGLGDYPQALKDFDQAIHISRGHLYLKDPIFFSYFFSRALARFNLGDYQGAIADLDRAINDFPHPDVPEAHVLRGISYGRLGRAEMAAEVLREYVTAIDDLDLGYRHNLQVASVFYTRGLAHFYLGNFLQAIVYFDEAIKLTPQLAEALAMRGRALLALGREGEAARDLERAERLNSG